MEHHKPTKKVKYSAMRSVTRGNWSKWRSGALWAILLVCIAAGSYPASARNVHTPPWSGQTIAVGDLPAQALDTLQRIQAGGPFPYREDASIFGNREGRLPRKSQQYYREYTVPTPGARDRGARRIIAGSNGELYYTDNHYRSFKRILR